MLLYKELSSPKLLSKEDIMKSKSIIFAIALAIFVTGCYEDPRYTAAKNYEVASDKLATCIKNESSCNDLANAKNEAFVKLTMLNSGFNPRDPYGIFGNR